MEVCTKLFFVGIVVGFGLTILEGFTAKSHPDDPIGFLAFSLLFGGYIVKISYFVLLIIILPIIAIPKLKKKLGSKSFTAYSVAAGITFWGAVDGLFILLSR